MTDQPALPQTIEPVPVAITTPVPIPVEVVGGAVLKHAPHIQSQVLDPSIPARTTFQEDLTTAGQRQINLIWERTQAVIAIVVVMFTMLCGVYAMIYNQSQIPTIMSVAFGTVVGFYFSRTNHSSIGGVGRKAEREAYTGR